MSNISRTFALGTAGLLVLALGLLPGRAAAQHKDHGHGDQEAAPGHSHSMSQLHGGLVTMTEANHFEVLLTKDVLRVYAYDKEQMPILELKAATGTAVLQSREGKPIELALEYVAPDPKEGRTQGYLESAYKAGNVEEGSMKALITLNGFGKSAVEFKTPVHTGMAMSYACPMNCVEPVQDPMSCPKCGMQMAAKTMKHNGEHEGHDHGHR